MTDDEAALAFGLTWLWEGRSAPDSLGLAVSGGSDSMALLHLVGPHLQALGRPVAVATVNHGLRPEAAGEAEMVAAACARLGISHDTLTWRGWDGRGNLPAAARDARYRLLVEWARKRGLSAVALAHTADDQAETVLMRIARGSGVDGLSGMAVDRRAGGMRWLRPLLLAGRQELRDWLTDNGVGWVDDPTNEDAKFDRIRIRQAMPHLAAIGITPNSLSRMVFLQGIASRALRDTAVQAARGLANQKGGAVVLARPALIVLPYEIQLRLISAALCWVSGNPYRPRMQALQPIHADAILRRKRTLHGAVLIGGKDRITIARELNPIRDLRSGTEAAWDNRWHLTGPHAPDLHVAALGDTGMLQCPKWRDTGLPRAALLSSPAIWRGGELISAPIARPDGVWQARVAPDFITFLQGD